MKILEVLEDRVNRLISVSIETTKKSKNLEKEIDTLKEELSIIKAENTKFAEDNAELITQLKSLELNAQKENKQLLDLS